jgi:hypothetical protein
MKKTLIVRVDTNDGDYEEARTPLNDEELELIMPVIEAIGKFKPYIVKEYGIDWKHEHNYPTGEMHRPDLGEKSAAELYGHLEGFGLFHDHFLPWTEFGIHTIKSITLEPEVESVKLL